MSRTLETAIRHTPQARDDYLSGYANDLIYMNVLNNDLGAKSLRLFSLDQSEPASATGPGETVTLASGAAIHISGHQIVYDPGTSFAALAEGEAGSDLFSYSLQLGNGALSRGMVHVTLQGVNDAPATTPDGASTIEDGSVISGNVGSNDTDPDNGAVLNYALASAVAGLTFDADGSWSFDPGNQAYQYLDAGEELNLIIPYSVTDEHGATSQSELTLLVTGVDDDIRLATVTYSTPALLSGPISFGLFALPETVTVTFEIRESAFGLDQIGAGGLVTFDLDDIVSAEANFGNGHWTALSNFSMIMSEDDGELDFLDLNYSFHPVAAEGVANGIVVNNSFQLTVSGIDIPSSHDFSYFYSESVQYLTWDPGIIVL